MSLTKSEAIRKKTMNSPEIKTYVTEIIERLDGAINEVCLTQNYIDHEMPLDIFIPGLNKSNAQRIIYYKVGKMVHIHSLRTPTFNLKWVRK